MSLSFESVSDSQALSEKIVAQITDAIVKGELKPDDRMPTERDLAVQFNVSRTVIRDSVKILTGRGMLRVKHGSGIFVATAEEAAPGALNAYSSLLSVGGPTLRDLFEVRKVLETQSARWAATRAKKEHLKRLAEILDDAFGHANASEILNNRDAQFHVALAESSGNLVLVRTMLALLDLLAASRQETLSIPGRAQRSLEEHARILACVRERDAEGAQQAMLEHLDSVEHSLAELNSRLKRETFS